MKYTIKGYAVADAKGKVDYRDDDQRGVQLWRTKGLAQDVADTGPGLRVVRATVTVEVEE